jgi:uncharacterized protein with HEPN domain
MKQQRADAARLQDVLDAISAIQRHPVLDRASFDEDELLRFFILKHIEIIGEAIFKVSGQMKAAHPEVPWTKVEKTRHILVHDYFDVNWDIVWKIVTEHLGSLRSQVEAVMRAEGFPQT